MSAATSPARAPLAQEGQAYWEHFVDECMRQTEAINAVAAQRGFAGEHLVQCAPGAELHMLRAHLPSTSIEVDISFHSWGPVIRGRISGRDYDDLEFRPEELDVPIAKDLDGTVIAIFDQGRSFSPEELAMYLTQSFRRCFPGLSLPCRNSSGA